MSNQENTNTQQPPKRNLTWLWILLVGVVIIGGYCYWLNTKTANIDSFDLPETWMDSVAREMDSVRRAALDTTMTETKEVSNKPSTNTHYNQSSSSYSYDDDEELNDDPEYREGGKYDPAKYHTDYSEDQEERRRRFIDNDGFDDDDGYDEYRGYEHENERSAQWDD